MRRPTKDTAESARKITRRAAVVGGLQVGVMGILGWRMHQMQIDRADEYRFLAEENRINVRLLPPARGLIFDRDGVVWQMCELGKTDAGGGGTVAKYMAKRNIDTLDAGVPVLSMHAPFEVVSKYDCYMTYRAEKAIFEEN